MPVSLGVGGWCGHATHFYMHPASSLSLCLVKDEKSQRSQLGELWYQFIMEQVEIKFKLCCSNRNNLAELVLLWIRRSKNIYRHETLSIIWCHALSSSNSEVGWFRRQLWSEEVVRSRGRWWILNSETVCCGNKSFSLLWLLPSQRDQGSSI